MTDEVTVRELVLNHFRRAGLEPIAVEVRSFPGETIAIVRVDHDYERAIKIAKELDKQIENGFVSVREASKSTASIQQQPVSSVHDERIPQLIELLNARARTSESQPSLRYVPDVAERINLAVAPRHHLIFGRRGVGKTALLLEAKRLVEQQGAYTLWVNMHSLRALDKERAFLTVTSRLCDLGIGAFQGGASSQSGVSLLQKAREQIDKVLYESSSSTTDVSTLVPQLQQALSRFCLETKQALYIFLDDVHYLDMQSVPGFLDLLHGLTRDNPIWLKIAGIQHQMHWFMPSPPTGLQTGHDAAIINLDITLEQPEMAKRFLQDVLRGYVEECNASPVRAFLSAAAVDRLVLASGGVPRDFLTLCSSSLQTARRRSNARTVGVQDVNNAAGIAAQTKLQELEDDAAAARGRSEALVSTLQILREFLLNEQQITFLKVDFRDKESHSREYGLMQALADLRMLHLISSSLSDAHHAGRRSEVYLLDLSQYSGSRLKQKLQVLDFERGHIVFKRTRSHERPRVADSPRKLVEILRRAPLLELAKLSPIIGEITA